ncbi:Abi-domain-containing protein [Coniophora puteana RWD-64-598 SS2]|uniref:intramembrane prenyl-peptidase Rce1 n=1 Tax=Coniophora puteana (strain RWD-64-598) TaxID=741705 RepID=A0A5M3MQY3_CONPW|nr:Abi-domain-containing protein [Coniophora puteana RWD-64-598 SS2]EIW81569.1 Abi-domain-containing protein [Coniophora puteana RWD-64-598 SS2]
MQEIPSIDALRVLPTPVAHALALAFASAYVGAIYLDPSARIRLRPPGSDGRSYGEQRTRDDPAVIRARLRAVSIASLVCCAGVGGAVWNLGDQTPLEALRATYSLLGFPTLPLSHSLFSKDGIFLLLRTIRPHLLAPLWFLGPLYANWKQGNMLTPYSLAALVSDIKGLRNYVVAPLTEEIVFRSCILGVYRLARARFAWMVGVGPIFFGVAHLHHAYELYVQGGRTRTALRRAIFISLFQLAYTSLFGTFTGALLLRTHSLSPAFTAHAFCNVMGVPSIGDDMKSGFDVALAYIVGIAGFIRDFGPWTAPA